MPAGSRIRANNVFGLVSDNPLSAVAVALNSSGLEDLPAITLGSHHAVITLDPLRVHGDPEIIIVTVHSASSPVATITRAAYNTTARSHPQGTMWMHTPINEDYTTIITSSTRPSNPYNGEMAYETDTNRWVARSSSGVWLPSPHNPPACRVFNNANLPVVNNTNTALTFNSERYDTDSMHSTSSATERITFNTAGLYIIHASVQFSSDTDYIFLDLWIENQAASTLVWTNNVNPGASGTAWAMDISSVFKFAAGDWIRAMVKQMNTSAATNAIEAGASYSPEFGATWIGVG
jgi:hypothetical protein